MSGAFAHPVTRGIVGAAVVVLLTAAAVIYALGPWAPRAASARPCNASYGSAPGPGPGCCR